jgi:hypothetical protein
MHVILSEVSKGPDERALPRTSLRFQSEKVTLAAAETERRPTVLGLIASGRMRPDTGAVTVDGEADAAALRLRVALVDAPDVSDPAPDVTVARVVAEELMFAGRIGTRRATGSLLAQLGMTAQAALPMSDLAPAARVRLLAELATLREGVTGIVLTAPDRHGGDPRDWFAVAQGLADRGYAVLVIAGAAAVATIAARSADAQAPSLPQQEGGDTE